MQISINLTNVTLLVFTIAMIIIVLDLLSRNKKIRKATHFQVVCIQFVVEFDRMSIFALSVHSVESILHWLTIEEKTLMISFSLRKTSSCFTWLDRYGGSSGVIAVVSKVID